MRSLAVFMGASLIFAAPISASLAAMPFAGAGPASLAPASPALTRVEYFCSPGFVPTYGGRCVATMARDEVEIYVNEPIDGGVVAPPRPRRHHRHALHERY